jgi:hypothetical protein
MIKTLSYASALFFIFSFIVFFNVFFNVFLTSPAAFSNDKNQLKTTNEVKVQSSVVGNKVYLKKAKSYHFSDPNLIDVHVNGTDKRFFIGLKQGELSYRVGEEEHTHLILSKAQQEFLDEVSWLILDTSLTWDVEDKTLKLSGPLGSKELYDFLLKTCKEKQNANILLDLESKHQSKEMHPCLGYLNTLKEYALDLMLVDHARLKNRGLGLGGPEGLLWLRSRQGQLRLEEISGEVKASKSKEQSKGEMSFSSRISETESLTFTNGLEVGVQNNAVFSRAPIDWKNITSRIFLKIIKSNDKQALIELELDKSSLTGEKNVFKKESFKKQSQLELGKWIKLFSYAQSTKDQQKKSPLFVTSLLGLKSKSKSLQKKELWVKIKLLQAPH